MENPERPSETGAEQPERPWETPTFKEAEATVIRAVVAELQKRAPGFELRYPASEYGLAADFSGDKYHLGHVHNLDDVPLSTDQAARALLTLDVPSLGDYLEGVSNRQRYHIEQMWLRMLQQMAATQNGMSQEEIEGHQHEAQDLIETVLR